MSYQEQKIIKLAAPENHQLRLFKHSLLPLSCKNSKKSQDTNELKVLKKYLIALHFFPKEKPEENNHNYNPTRYRYPERVVSPQPDPKIAGVQAKDSLTSFARKEHPIAEKFIWPNIKKRMNENAVQRPIILSPHYLYPITKKNKIISSLIAKESLSWTLSQEELVIAPIQRTSYDVFHHYQLSRNKKLTAIAAGDMHVHGTYNRKHVYVFNNRTGSYYEKIGKPTKETVLRQIVGFANAVLAFVAAGLPSMLAEYGYRKLELAFKYGDGKTSCLEGTLPFANFLKLTPEKATKLYYSGYADNEKLYDGIVNELLNNPKSLLHAYESQILTNLPKQQNITAESTTTISSRL
jgi:hypothetical protein